MEIKNVTVYAVRLPFRKPFVLAYETYAHMPSVIIRVETDNGLAGYGEAVPDQHVTGETWEGTFRNLQHYLTPAVIGENPFDIAGIHEKMDRVLYGMPSAKAAVDIACYDLMGKATGQPVCRLIGGKLREQLEVPAVIGIGTPEEMAEEAATLRSSGHTDLKIKVGMDAALDIKRIRAVREAAGLGIDLRVDANQGWRTAAAALSVLREVEDCGIGWIEQPVAADDLYALAEVRSKTSIPVMADESVHGPKELREVIRLGAADYLNIKLMKCGGIHPARKLAAQAELAGISCIIGSMIESSVATAAGAHFAAATVNVIGNEMGGPLIFGSDVARLDYSGPFLRINDHPGLGINVDIRKLEELKIESAIGNV